MLRLWVSIYLAVCPGHSVGAGRDILWEIVSQCVDKAAQNYCAHCRWPQADSWCAPSNDCRGTTEVWARTANFVAIRDIKMCGCSGDFVHGLALPRQAVSGVEDPSRPAGLWAFAWEVARQRIAAEEIALVVNPPNERSQDQLHIHLLRLKPDSKELPLEFRAGEVLDLDDVWRVAAENARGRQLESYGVMVKQVTPRQFIVFVTEESPEGKFTLWRCP